MKVSGVRCQQLRTQMLMHDRKNRVLSVLSLSSGIVPLHFHTATQSRVGHCADLYPGSAMMSESGGRGGPPYITASSDVQPET
jgi:hypothetical protein